MLVIANRWAAELGVISSTLAQKTISGDLDTGWTWLLRSHKWLWLLWQVLLLWNAEFPPFLTAGPGLEQAGAVEDVPAQDRRVE